MKSESKHDGPIFTHRCVYIPDYWTIQILVIFPDRTGKVFLGRFKDQESELMMRTKIAGSIRENRSQNRLKRMAA